MRILAWNAGWNWGEPVVRAQTAAVDALGADVAFFSEWSPVRDRLTSAGTLRASSGYLRGGHLADIGLGEQCQEHVTDREGDGRPWTTQHWGILAASREPITKTTLMPPLHAPGSWLEVTHQRSGLTLVGLRMPAWEGRSIYHRRELWEWMFEQFQRLTSTQAIVMGDFNTEMHYASESRAQTYGGDLLRSLTREHGWRDPYDATRTTKQPTFWHRSSRRIDYALVSPGFYGSIDAVDAPTQVGDLVTSGPSRTEDGKPRGRLADHAPLIIEVSPAAVAETVMGSSRSAART